MKRILFIAILLLFVAIPGSAFNFTIGSTGYDFGVQFNATANPGTGVLTNYPILLNVSNASGVSSSTMIYTNGSTLPNWYDIAFTNESDTEESFWIENRTETSTGMSVWVRPPTQELSPGTIVRMYYGNSSKSSSDMNGYVTFSTGIFDDFIGTSLNTTQWIQGGSGTYTQANGFETISSSAASGVYIVSKTQFAANYSVRSRFNVSTEANYWDVGFWNPSVALVRADLSYQSGDVVLSGDGAIATTAITTSLVTMGVGDVYRNGTSTLTGRWNNSAPVHVTTHIPSTSLNATIAPANTKTMYADWIFVRPYQWPEPITSDYTQLAPAGGSPPVASLTSSDNPAYTGNTVTFTDTSTNTPEIWNITFDGGTTWDNSSSPPWTNTFTLPGTYNVTMLCNNTFGTSDPFYLDQVVTNSTNYTVMDMYQTGSYVRYVHVEDTDGVPLSGASVTWSDGQSVTTDSIGNCNVTIDAGIYTIVTALSGYYTDQLSVAVEGTGTTTVVLTASTSSTGIDLKGTPKDVKFHIQSFWGAPIYNANVSIQGVSTTTGNWDWLAVLLSISLGETPINTTEMSGFTDTNGDIVFLMLDTIKYNVTVSASGYTFPTMIISPQASQYTISANMNQSWFSSGNNTLEEVNVTVSWVSHNSTYSFMNITYDDQTGTTTGGTIYVYKDSAGRVANQSPYATMDITDSSCNNSTLLEVPVGGSSYRVDVNATTSTGNNIVRTFTHYFKGSPVNLPGFTPETLLWLSLFIIFFTAAFAGATHSPQMAIILCVESWVFWAIGWLDGLMTEFWYGETAVFGYLVLATFVTIWWNIQEGKAKGKRSS